MKAKVKVTYEATIRVRWSHTVVTVVEDPEPTENHFERSRRLYDEALRRSSRCGKPALPKTGTKIHCWAVTGVSEPRYCEMQEVEND